jgi:Ca2+-binding EF-hand superfamily protein
MAGGAAADGGDEAARRRSEDAAALRRVFAFIDTDGSGSLSVAELSAVMGADASALMVAAEAAADDTLDFAKFSDLVEASEFFSQSRATFDELDANHDGRVTREEVEQWLSRQLGEDEARSRAAELTGNWATRGGAYRSKAADEPVSFADFFLFVTQSARSLPLLHALGRTGGRAAYGLREMGDKTIGELAGFSPNFGDVWGRYGTGLYETPGGRPGAGDSAGGSGEGGGEGGGSGGSERQTPSQTASSHGHATVLRHMAAGAIAGTLAKTAIAPCDRVKIIFQVSKRPFSLRAAARFGADIVQKEGILKLWKGHGAMVARVLPYAAIHFAAHEQLNASLAPKPGERLPIGE